MRTEGKSRSVPCGCILKHSYHSLSWIDKNDTIKLNIVMENKRQVNWDFERMRLARDLSIAICQTDFLQIGGCKPSFDAEQVSNALA